MRRCNRPQPPPERQRFLPVGWPPTKPKGNKLTGPTQRNPQPQSCEEKVRHSEFWEVDMLFAQFRGAVGCGPIPTWLEKDRATILGSPLRAKGVAQEPQLDPAQLQRQVHISTAGSSTAATSGSHLHSSQGPGEEGSGCSVSL